MPLLRRADGEKLSLFPMAVWRNGTYYSFLDARQYRRDYLTYVSYDPPDVVLEPTGFDAFAERYPLPSDIVSMLDIRRVELIEGFVGRSQDVEWLLDLIRGRRQRDIFVFGGPGVGKSAFASHLEEVALKEQFMCISSYFDANDQETLRPDSLYDNLSRGLMHQGIVIKGLRHPENAPRAVSSALFELLREATSAADAMARNLVVLIDGLDEALHGGARHCLEALPKHSPPGCTWVFFSRPDPLVEALATARSAAIRELGPLTEDGTRAFLENAIPWRRLQEKPHLTGLVHEASEGNPLYLKHLTEHILEHPEDSELLNLPKGMEDRYGQILRQLARIPRALELAELLAISAEPLPQGQLHAMLGEEDEARVDVAVDSLMQVLRKVRLPDGAFGLLFFHYGITQVVLRRPREGLVRAQKRLLRWQSHGAVDVDDLADCIQRGQILEKHPDAIPALLRRLSTREILVLWLYDAEQKHQVVQSLFDLDRHRRDGSLGWLAVEVLRLQLSHDVHRFADTFAPLLSRHHDRIELYDVALEALLCRKLSDNLSDHLVLRVAERLRRGARNAVFFQLLGSVSALARLEEGFDVFWRIVEAVLPLRGRERSGERRSAAAAVRFLASSRALHALLTEVHQINAETPVFLGGETLGQAAARLAAALLLRPRLWPRAARVSLPALHLALTHLRHLYPALRAALTFIDLATQLVPMVFTMHDRPALTPEGADRLERMEKRCRDISRSLAGEGRHDLVELVESDLRDSPLAYRGSAKDILFAGTLLVFGPHLRDMFNYSKIGLQAMVSYTAGEAEQVARCCRRLSQETHLSSEDEAALLDLLRRPDAFRNYVAMLTLIVHFETELPACRRIIDAMLDDPTHLRMRPGRAQARLRLKLFRQAVSIFSYVFRRTEKQDFAHEAASYLESILDRLREELMASPDLSRAFATGTIFGQDDPFFPLLPLGIYCSGRLVHVRDEGLFLRVLAQWLDTTRGLEAGRHLLFRRCLSELVPLSYFDPDFAIRQALALTGSATSRSQMDALGHTVGLIDRMAPGRLRQVLSRRTAASPGAADLSMREATGGRLGDAEGELRRLIKAMRVFAWHECITTIMVSHPRVAQVVLETLDSRLRSGQSINAMAAEGIRRLWQDFLSEAVARDMYRFFGLERPTCD